jgi:hypothetical protein
VCGQQPRSCRSEVFYTHEVEARLSHAAKTKARQSLNVIEIELLHH